MKIDHLDHLVLTVESINSSVAFYERLGFEHVVTDDRHALRFGQSKINLHQHGHSFQPSAEHPTPGSGDLCFIVDDGPESIRAAITSAGIPIEEGPTERSGALGPMTSVYIRDPDQNLLELSTYQ
ncbi:MULTISPECIES: VOC family protein [unclassified Curtobacterium]|jgi:catechol 2,3-dioxygenase-like lactoylglutathione lyase family enzyme|uniref:VOC family protein n=1 Tax=unclassified Curtobacterium TaxID=257496 RepID=UPI0028645B03|nr:VOC family protein [Curtobacterium sp. 320]MDR6573605.1 catechol 2,3-dioxygenase-like lactoylglutathione lyase family enzyme [Curtobacterium sp. 320]